MKRELEILKRTSKRKWFELQRFIRLQAAALIQGEYRYCNYRNPNLFLTRLIKELEAYKKSGNKEHLINVCNYAILESIEPEHPNHHYNDEVESITRSIVAWNKTKSQ